MTILIVRHVTVYRYRVPAAFGDHRMMFRPRDGDDQKLLDESLSIVPQPKQIRWVHDVFRNFVTVASFEARADVLSFTSRIRLEHTPANLPDLQIEPEATVYPPHLGLLSCLRPMQLPDPLPMINSS